MSQVQDVMRHDSVAVEAWLFSLRFYLFLVCFCLRVNKLLLENAGKSDLFVKGAQKTVSADSIILCVTILTSEKKSIIINESNEGERRRGAFQRAVGRCETARLCAG